LLSQQRIFSNVVEVSRIVRDIDSSVSRYEDLMRRLLNFDTSLLTQIRESIVRREELKKIDEIIVEKLLLPHIYVFENETYLYVIGFYLTKAENIALPILEDYDKRRYISFGYTYYPLGKANIETMLLLVMNRNALLEKISEHMSVSPVEMNEYIERCFRESKNFYTDLKQIPVYRLVNLALSNGYKTFVVFNDSRNSIKISFEYYNIDSALWSYYGINDLYTVDVNRFDELVSENSRVLENLLELRDVLNKIETYVSTSYLLTKIIEGIST